MAYDTHLTEARAALQAAKSAINAELRAYPTPISGCDAQYNHMVAQRGAITEALHALNTLPFVATPRTPEPNAGVESR